MKHTTGPWEFASAGFGHPWKPFKIDEYFVRRPGDDIAIAGDIIDPKTCIPSEANARLIAAAPELLEALLFVMTAHGEQLSTAFEVAQAAIKKATGESV